MPKTFTHWISFDTGNMQKVRDAFSRGSGFAIKRAYTHPTDMGRIVVEVNSTEPYEHLDLSVNSFTSPLRRHAKRPAGLSSGMPLDAFTKIYGPLMPNA